MEAPLSKPSAGSAGGSRASRRAQTRYATKYRHRDGALVLKVTDDVRVRAPHLHKWPLRDSSTPALAVSQVQDGAGAGREEGGEANRADAVADGARPGLVARHVPLAATPVRPSRCASADAHAQRTCLRRRSSLRHRRRAAAGEGGPGRLRVEELHSQRSFAAKDEKDSALREREKYFTNVTRRQPRQALQ